MSSMERIEIVFDARAGDSAHELVFIMAPVE